MRCTKETKGDARSHRRKEATLKKVANSSKCMQTCGGTSELRAENWMSLVATSGAMGSRIPSNSDTKSPRRNSRNSIGILWDTLGYLGSLAEFLYIC